MKLTQAQKQQIDELITAYKKTHSQITARIIELEDEVSKEKIKIAEATIQKA